MNKKRFSKIYVEITNCCNLHCKFCPDTKRKNEYMSSDNFKNIVERIKSYTECLYLHVKGEPLLHPKFADILKICDENNIKVNITTNGTLILKNIEYIIQTKVINQINISLHSIEQNDDMDYLKYLDDVLYSCNMINQKTDILVALRLWNLEDINKNEKNIKILNRLEKEFNIEELARRASNEKAIKLKPKTYLNQDNEFIWPNINSEKINEYGKCYGLRNQIAILVDGTVVPCCLDQDGDIILGNIYNETIDEILAKDKCKKIIKNFEKHEIIEPLCKTCGFIKRFNKKI